MQMIPGRQPGGSRWSWDSGSSISAIGMTVRRTGFLYLFPPWLLRTSLPEKHNLDSIGMAYTTESLHLESPIASFSCSRDLVWLGMFLELAGQWFAVAGAPIVGMTSTTTSQTHWSTQTTSRVITCPIRQTSCFQRYHS